jgi:hypothetical protein
VLSLGLAAVLLGVAWRVAPEPDGDRRAFGLAVVAALAASPIVWPHYLVLMFVPIALTSSRLSAVWFVPLLAWLAPTEETHGHLWEILPYWSIEAAVTFALLAPRRRLQSKSGSPTPVRAQLLRLLDRAPRRRAEVPSVLGQWGDG